MSDGARTGGEATASWRGWKIVPTSRQATQWTFAILGLVMVIALLIMSSYMVLRHPRTWDLTSSRRFSLAEQTLGVLEQLDRPVTMLGFVEGGESPAMERLLRAYAERTDLVQYELVDPSARPALTREYEVRKFGTVVVEAGGRVQWVESPDEAKITNALLSAVRGESVPVCYVVGHGERGLEDPEAEGYAAANRVLEQTNYAVEEVNLASVEGLGDRCRLAILAAPSTDLLESEVEVLESYLQGDGRLLVLLEPGSRLPRLFDLLSRYGLGFTDDLVIDTSRNGQAMGLGMEAPLVDRYPTHPVTDDFRLMTLYHTARSVLLREDAPGEFDRRVLARTSESSWGETNLEGGRAARWDEAEDVAGPVPLVVAVATAVEETPARRRQRRRAQEPPPVGEPRLVVAGDADFASNRFFDNIEGNGDLFLNSVNWLSGQEELIAVRPKAEQNKRVPLTGQRRLLVLLVAVVGLPLLPTAIGVITLVKKVK